MLPSEREGVAMGRVRLGVLLLGTALTFAACGGGSATSGTPDAAGTRVNAALARVLGSLGDPMVKGAEVVDDPDDLDCRYPCLRVRLDSTRSRGVKEVWLGQLIEGAVAELARTPEQKTAPRVLATELVTRSATGQREITPIDTGYSPLGHGFDSPTDAELRLRAASVADRYGLGVTSVEVVHPLDSALAVTFTVPPGKPAWSFQELEHELLGSPIDIEGIYLQLNSPSGRPLFSIENGERVSGGAGWAAPGQAERFGLVNG